MPMVVRLDGYLVMWPFLLTLAISVARMRPFDPPLIHASCEFVVLQGSVMWIVPVVNATHLFFFFFFFPAVSRLSVFFARAPGGEGKGLFTAQRGRCVSRRQNVGEWICRKLCQLLREKSLRCLTFLVSKMS